MRVLRWLASHLHYTGMSEWAKNNYEPTFEEIEDSFAYFRETLPGHHGVIELLPSMEHYIWMIEGIYWAGREVVEEGRVRYRWLRIDPDLLIHDD
jgi:hypothetical protein